MREGRYTSVSAVVQQGIDLLRQRAEAEALELVALRSLLEERQAGSFVTPDVMRGRIASMVNTKRAGNDLAD